MKNKQRWVLTFVIMLVVVGVLLLVMPSVEDEVRREEMVMHGEDAPEVIALTRATGLEAEWIALRAMECGIAPEGFLEKTGAEYRPAFNPDPAIPAQCWIETGYGTQNACKYCHTDYLTQTNHGNNFPIGEDQVLFSFPTPKLNLINWKNITHPQQIVERLEAEGIVVPDAADPANLEWVRRDNWRDAYTRGRGIEDDSWNNLSNRGSDLQLLPALNPDDLYPWKGTDPTDGGRHGYVAPDGFVMNAKAECTGWRAVNFFPYAIFTPLTGSVSGIYIRLPRPLREKEGRFDMDTYVRNLDLLEKQIKNRAFEPTHYFGDAAEISVDKGFYPVGTEFAHPLHYVDLNADGERGVGLDGVVGESGESYEFPGTRSRRVKEIRYMYKWKAVTLADIAPAEEEADAVQGKEWKGWIDNGAGWILAAFIERRDGGLRPQTTEELMQCLGCHSAVGNTVDAVWSFQRKLPGETGWGEMDYGSYSRQAPQWTQLNDYVNPNVDRGEMEYFYASVVGADLYGVMPTEIKTELISYAQANDLQALLELKHSLEDIFDDEALKTTPRHVREPILRERAAIMRRFAAENAYLDYNAEKDEYFIKGSIFYPSVETMQGNIAAYRRIVLDQSFNLGKHVFGLGPGAIPFTFRSDGEVLNARREPIPVGEVIDGRPYGEDGVGTTPTGLTPVDDQGRPVDAEGNPVDLETHPEHAAGHISRGGTFDTRYTPILSDRKVRPEKK